MKILFNKKFLKHNPEHIEGSYRIEKFLEQEKDVEYNGEQFISLIHSQEYINRIKESCDTNGLAAEVELTKESYEAACTAVGLSILASQQNDFAVVRPPGHHADRELEAGFCLFNNIAIASQKLINEGKKVCIVDIDGHHGNGTQWIFYNSDKLLYCSIHQWPAYPGTGRPSEIGESDGKGYTLNIPLSPGSGDDLFLSALNKFIPYIKKFNPDVIGVSAGFDGFYQDQLLNLLYTTTGYYECGQILKSVCNNVFATLEGGYHYLIKECVESFIAGVNGDKIKTKEQKAISTEQCHKIFKANVGELKQALK